MNLVPARPSGPNLVMPMATLVTDDQLRQRIGARDLVIVGIRPEACHDATSVEGRSVVDGLEFTTRIDDVEWQGRSQLLYLGFDLDEDVEAQLSEIEDDLDYDLFGNFFVAELPAGTELRSGMSARIVVPRGDIHVFDPQTGESLMRA
jgi:multiple sugar transport system ATP-binding protein